MKPLEEPVIQRDRALFSKPRDKLTLEEIKKNSSKWVKAQRPDLNLFAWQNGYAVFSVSSSRIGAVTNYIKKQKEHHKRLTFKEEVIRFLDEYDVEYDEKYLWD